MSDTPLWQLSACELAEKIAKRDTSASEAVAATLARVAEKNPAMNAIVDEMGDEARQEADRLDQIMAKDGPVGPLHGVPITIKENVDQKGRATPNGVTAFKDIMAPDDAPLVKNLTRAGAIVIGRTNTPEFSFRGTTDNELHGRTFNPWNDWASAGGSSGGASSAVMSGMGAIGHGNDIAGSLRYPSTATGAATVKPGLGRVPAWNPSQKAERGLIAQLMSVQGVIAREIKDVRLAMRELVKYNPNDPWQVPAPLEISPEQKPKIAFTRSAFGLPIAAEVDAAVTAARDALVDAGYEVEEADPPNVREIANEALRTLFGEVKVLMLDDIRKYGSKTINGIFDNYLALSPPYEGDELVAAMARRSHYVREWMLYLTQYPLVLTPFLLKPTYVHDRDAQGLEGAEEVLHASIYSVSMNYMGLPAGNIPANYNNGLPVGVQIVGRRFMEDAILDACEAVEDRVGIMAHQLFEMG